MGNGFFPAMILVLLVLIGLPAYAYWWARRPPRLPDLGQRADRGPRAGLVLAAGVLFSLTSALFAIGGILTGKVPALSKHNWYVDVKDMPALFWFTVSVWLAATLLFAAGAWVSARRVFRDEA